MTHREKIEKLRKPITYLYAKEGRSKSYISKLFEIDRRVLTQVLNKEWKLKQANKRNLKPSNQKFLNRHKQYIKSQLDQDVTIKQIASNLQVTTDYLSRTIISNDEVLDKAREDYLKRKRVEKEPTKYDTPIQNLEGEEWRPILGYPNYRVSNLGRVKSNKIGDKDIYYEITPNANSRTGRYYVHLTRNGKRKALSLPRLVGHSFIKGYTEHRNTINHIDGDVSNNKASNLEWVSQSENNKHSYRQLGRPVNVANKEWKKIILDNKYEFKTIVAFAKFIGKSETQARRYITEEAKYDRKIDIIY